MATPFNPNPGQRRALAVQKPGVAGNASRAYLLNRWAPAQQPGPRATPTLGPGGTAGPASSPPVAPASQMPWDTQFENTKALLGNQLAQGQTGLNSQEAIARSQYGIEDVSDPFSRAAMLQRAYQQNKQSINTGAGRQLYAGSYQNSQNQADYGYNQGYDALSKEYQSVMQGLIQKRQGLQDTYNEGVIGAQGAALDRSLAQPLVPEPKVGLQGKTVGGGKAIVAKGAITKADRRAAKKKK